MSSTAGYASRKGRRATAYAEKMRAKQKRQTIIVVVLCVLLLGVLAYELPKELSRSKPQALPVVPVAPTPSSTAKSDALRAWRALQHQTVVDPFSAAASGGTEPAARDDIAVPAGLHDPFASSGAVTTPTTTTPSQSSPLPEKIVIGAPGAGRIAVHGWIVILASIPTAQGRASAQAFASKATSAGIGSVAILNSSNRRPLRGGYWVVYTGPFSTLSAVSAVAGGIHTQGYATAYIRELIVYQ
jgi:hypothetical protein